MGRAYMSKATLAQLSLQTFNQSHVPISACLALLSAHTYAMFRPNDLSYHYRNSMLDKTGGKCLYRHKILGVMILLFLILVSIDFFGPC